MGLPGLSVLVSSFKDCNKRVSVSAAAPLVPRRDLFIDGYCFALNRRPCFETSVLGGDINLLLETFTAEIKTIQACGFNITVFFDGFLPVEDKQEELEQRDFEKCERIGLLMEGERGILRSTLSEAKPSCTIAAFKKACRSLKVELITGWESDIDQWIATLARRANAFILTNDADFLLCPGLLRNVVMLNNDFEVRVLENQLTFNIFLQSQFCIQFSLDPVLLPYISVFVHSDFINKKIQRNLLSLLEAVSDSKLPAYPQLPQAIEGKAQIKKIYWAMQRIAGLGLEGIEHLFQKWSNGFSPATYDRVKRTIASFALLPLDDAMNPCSKTPPRQLRSLRPHHLSEEIWEQLVLNHEGVSHIFNLLLFRTLKVHAGMELPSREYAGIVGAPLALMQAGIILKGAVREGGTIIVNRRIRGGFLCNDVVEVVPHNGPDGQSLPAYKDVMKDAPKILSLNKRKRMALQWLRCPTLLDDLTAYRIDDKSLICPIAAIKYWIARSSSEELLPEDRLQVWQAGLLIWSLLGHKDEPDIPLSSQLLTDNVLSKTTDGKVFISPVYAGALHFFTMWQDLSGEVSNFLGLFDLRWGVNKYKLCRQVRKLFLIWKRAMSERELASSREKSDELALEAVMKGVMSTLPVPCWDLWSSLMRLVYDGEDVVHCVFSDLQSQKADYPSSVAFAGHFPVHDTIGRTWSQTPSEVDGDALKSPLSDVVSAITHFTIDEELESVAGEQDDLELADFQYLVEGDQGPQGDTDSTIIGDRGSAAGAGFMAVGDVPPESGGAVTPSHGEQDQQEEEEEEYPYEDDDGAYAAVSRTASTKSANACAVCQLPASQSDKNRSWKLFGIEMCKSCLRREQEDAWEDMYRYEPTSSARKKEKAKAWEEAE